MLWIICAIARPDESCNPEKTCRNCKHNPTRPYAVYKGDCMGCMEPEPFGNWEG
jgi:hypothetical protein